MKRSAAARRPLSRPATGSDVARLAGVSKSAVSRAYTGGIVSDEARRRIFDAAKVLRYRPSQAARSLTTSRSSLIGLTITHLDNLFYPEVVERFSARLRREGYRLVLFVTEGETDLEPVIDELLGLRLDGIILASSSMAARIATECRELGVPTIMFNNVDPDARAPGVSAENRRGSAEIARYLASIGHERFGMITGLAESTTSVERCTGFCEELVMMGRPPPLIRSGQFSFEGASEATHALLQMHNPVDAIFCANDHMAIACLQSARARGLVPGRDLSVVGFDDVAISSWPAFDLTTYSQPVTAMVEQTVARLIGAIGGEALMPETARLSGELMIRGSTRSPALSGLDVAIPA